MRIQLTSAGEWAYTLTHTEPRIRSTPPASPCPWPHESRAPPLPHSFQKSRGQSRAHSVYRLTPKKEQREGMSYPYPVLPKSPISSHLPKGGTNERQRHAQFAASSSWNQEHWRKVSWSPKSGYLRDVADKTFDNFVAVNSVPKKVKKKSICSIF